MVINAEIEIFRKDCERVVEIAAQVHDGYVEFFYRVEEELTPDEWEYAERRILEQYNG